MYRQRRKKHKEKMKQKERIAKKLQTHRPGETIDGHDMELFKLSTIKSQYHLNALGDAEMLQEEFGDEEDVSTVRGDTFEVVPAEKSLKRPRQLDPEGLALGALLKKSKKSREDLIESGYNRWTNNDDNLPDWFVQDEAKHCQKQLPVTKEMVREFKERLKEINARPIKKIAEAKARKKRRTLKRLEKIKKKVQGVVDTPDALDSEKMQQLKKLYQKAKQSSGRSKEVQYVVAKKGIGKRVSRPAGVSGCFKVVDPRMKKDSKRNTKNKKKSRH